MKFFARKQSAAPSATGDVPAAPRVDRRSLVVGAGVAGAAAVATAALHRQVAEEPAAAAAGEASSADGYRVTPHVLRYYETTRA